MIFKSVGVLGYQMIGSLLLPVAGCILIAVTGRAATAVE